ncbi:SDR family NAD(P)-dependent oxidoreductase [Natronosporangium hydrolyticum]|nr:SDR family NAD(P)-dependent oxidoreductase [Natronosporangium hydrolyticum]
MADFQGMTAVVTGGGSGIGAACVAALHAAGAQVGILDLQPGDTTDPGLLPVPADVADDASVKTAVARVADQFGGLDILVNSAGVGAAGPLEGHDDAEWARVLDVNVTGIARACRAALPYLRRSRHGSIVNLSSIAAWAGLPNRSLYSASKGAVHALTFALAADLVADQIRVNCVCPGTVDTPWVTRLLAAAEDPAAERARLASRQPSGRLVSAAEVAAAVCYLAGPAAGSTTGTALAVDGGMHGLRLPPPG